MTTAEVLDRQRLLKNIHEKREMAKEAESRAAEVVAEFMAILAKCGAK